MDKEDRERIPHEDNRLHAVQSTESAIATFADSILMLLSSAENVYPRGVLRRYKRELHEVLTMAQSLARRKREVYATADTMFREWEGAGAEPAVVRLERLLNSVRTPLEGIEAQTQRFRKESGRGRVRRKGAIRRKRVGYGMGRRRVSTTPRARGRLPR